MHITLVRLGEKNWARELWLDRFPIRIGRNLQLDVSLNEPGVSWFHCELAQINGILFVRDLGSASGTFVNGFHVVRSDLLPGDQLTVGQADFRVFYPRDRSAAYYDIEREMTLAPIGARRTPE
jgi:pSer/pThr/pTyr-binding forkhead associated (FHA) protein